MKLHIWLPILSASILGIVVTASSATSPTSLPIPPAAERAGPAGEETEAAKAAAVPQLAPLAAPTSLSAPLTEAVPREWIPQGPGPTHGGQVALPPDNPVVGAVQAVAPHPTDASILYLGAVNGGVWRTANATSISPNWTPLTDRFPSLSISTLKFDPTDAANLTLVAGTGRRSNFNGKGGPEVGVYRTTDGGNTWTHLGAVDLAGRRITSVAPRGNVILVAVAGGTNPGLYRSDNTGIDFDRISGVAPGLPSGAAFNLAGDPTDPDNIYVTIAGATFGGVYFSDDTGQTWTDVTDTTLIRTANIVDGAESNIKLAVTSGGDAIFLAVCNNAAPFNGSLTGVFRSPIPASDGTWVSYGMPSPTIHPGTQCGANISIVAEPDDNTTVYIGGDRQVGNPNFPNAIGATDFEAQLWRGNGPNDWDPITHDGTANGTSPHADSRDMAFDAIGDLIEGDDGGIYVQTEPSGGNGDWISLIGDLQVTELHDVAYDENSDIIIGGAQDNGVPQQQTPDGFTWEAVLNADGGDVAVDNTTLEDFDWSIRYSSTQQLGGFRADVYDENNVFQFGLSPSLTTDSGTVLVPGPMGNAQFKTPIELNAVDPGRLIIGANVSYESLNQGSNVDEIFLTGGVSFQINRPGAIAYGGWTGGVPNEDVLYAGSGNQVFVRTVPGADLGATASLPCAPTPCSPANVTDIVLDPDDWMTAYVTTLSSVYSTNNAGASWTNITGNLSGVNNIQTIVFVPGTIPVIFVGAESGVYEMRTNLPGTWGEAGAHLPEAPIFDLDYVASLDILLAGTLGRGAWILSDVSIAPHLQVPNDIAFGEVCTGTIATETLQVCNAGNADLAIDEITSSDPQFAVTAPSGGFPVIISPDFCFPFEVTYTPDPEGDTSANLTIVSNDPAQPNVDVEVTGDNAEPDININIANSGDFGNVCKGEHDDLDVNLLNQGQCDLIISDISLSPNAGSFELPADLKLPLKLSPDADFSVPVRYSPAVCNDSTESRTIEVDSNDPDEPTVTVDISGTSACPNLVIDPTSLTGLQSFPTTVVDSTGTLGCYSERKAVLRNNSVCPLTITDISTSGPDFSVTAPTEFPILLPGGEETLETTVRFTPQSDADPLAPGELTDELVVTSDDPDSAHNADLCGESAQQSGVRLLVTDVSSGDPLIVDEVDSLSVQSKGKGKPGPINLMFTDLPVSSAQICGNTIQYHVNLETLPSTSSDGSNPKSSYQAKAQEGNLQTTDSFGLGQCEFRDAQLQLQDSNSGICLLLAKGEMCTLDSECCSGKCKGPTGGKTCK